jgi:hypothetical protein
MIYKLAEAAEKSWRRLNGHNQLPKVILGVEFADGIEVIRPQAQAAACPLPSPRFGDSSGASGCACSKRAGQRRLARSQPRLNSATPGLELAAPELVTYHRRSFDRSLVHEPSTKASYPRQRLPGLVPLGKTASAIIKCICPLLTVASAQHPLAKPRHPAVPGTQLIFLR